MTGEEHYLEAERLIGLAESPAGALEGPRWLAQAQVHATLALTAAVRTASDPTEGGST